MGDQELKLFALIGAGGYVVPRHMKAIGTVGGELKAAFDPSDSVGVIDSHFPDTQFLVEFERFDRHLDKLRRRGDKIEHRTGRKLNTILQLRLHPATIALKQKWTIRVLPKPDNSMCY